MEIAKKNNEFNAMLYNLIEAVFFLITYSFALVRAHRLSVGTTEYSQEFDVDRLEIRS